MLDAEEIVSVPVAREGGAEYIDRARPAHVQAAVPRSRKEPLPFHASAAGKALLANWDKSAARNFLGSGRAVSLTHNTITDQPSLAAELDRARQLGYAVDDQEHRVGIRCVAAPILGSNGRVRASIYISANIARMPPARISVLGRTLCQAAQRVSRSTGDLIAA